ncbi:inhibitor of growth proteins N-terminal histone-binding-domain-containing protein [Entophlyctis helioformis]|nr:inhibitor of growth proteins N-terminal histone-binding-domain-containing protein [Entophlyctis helioformis]
MAATSYLEDYLDTLESLPLELARNFTLIRELDAQAQDAMSRVRTETQAFMDDVRNMSRQDRIAHLEALSGLFKGCLKHGHDKVALAMQTYDMVDRHIRRLDEDLAKYEEEQMTGPKILSSAATAYGAREDIKAIRVDKTRELVAQRGGRRSQVTASDTPTKRKRIQDDRDPTRDSPTPTPQRPAAAYRGAGSANSSSINPNGGSGGMGAGVATAAPIAGMDVGYAAASVSAASGLAMSIQGGMGNGGGNGNGSGSGNGGNKKSTVKNKKSEIKIGKDKFAVDMEIDPNEPTYCICKQVSFGEMIAVRERLARCYRHIFILRLYRPFANGPSLTDHTLTRTLNSSELGAQRRACSATMTTARSSGSTTHVSASQILSRASGSVPSVQRSARNDEPCLGTRAPVKRASQTQGLMDGQAERGRALLIGMGRVRLNSFIKHASAFMA